MKTNKEIVEEFERIFQKKIKNQSKDGGWLHDGTRAIDDIYAMLDLGTILNKTLTTCDTELREEIGEAHNLETGYQNTDCGLTDHTPQWDGNFYTCRFCGKEFIQKDHILTLLKEREADTKITS